MTKNHADYEVVRVEEDRIFIVDLDLGNKSVTNDALFVYHELNNNFPGKRVIYRDTIGNWDELYYNTEGSWKDQITYKFYDEHVPDISEITLYPSSALIRRK